MVPFLSTHFLIKMTIDFLITFQDQSYKNCYNSAKNGPIFKKLDSFERCLKGLLGKYKFIVIKQHRVAKFREERWTIFLKNSKNTPSLDQNLTVFRHLPTSKLISTWKSIYQGSFWCLWQYWPSMTHPWNLKKTKFGQKIR